MKDIASLKKDVLSSASHKTSFFCFFFVKWYSDCTRTPEQSASFCPSFGRCRPGRRRGQSRRYNTVCRYPERHRRFVCA